MRRPLGQYLLIWAAAGVLVPLFFLVTLPLAEKIGFSLLGGLLTTLCLILWPSGLMLLGTSEETPKWAVLIPITINIVLYEIIGLTWLFVARVRARRQNRISSPQQENDC